MRLAVVSDIHSNLPALEAVLVDVDAQRPDAIWCLGDVVGYGPFPNECCMLVRERTELCLAGNHDLVVLGAISIGDFSGDAAAAAAWTRTVLSDESRAFLSRLEPTAERGGVDLFHGGPVDPVWSYVLDEHTAYLTFQATQAPLVLVGHSHVALEISFDGRSVQGGLAPAGMELELDGPRRLLNPGSVGQPRDSNPLAAWLLVDTDSRRAIFRRVEYPIEKTQAAIRERALPEALAARLATGV